MVPNIVEVKEPAPNTKERSKKTILYVGAFRKVKNLPLLVEAVRLLAEKRRDFRVIVVGDGEERERIVGMVKSLGLEPFSNFAEGSCRKRCSVFTPRQMFWQSRAASRHSRLQRLKPLRTGFRS